jgi:hypothetical protein
MEFTFPIGLDGRDRASWHGHALIHDLRLHTTLSNKLQPTLDLAPSQELDLVLEPIWAQYSLSTQDPLDLVFPSDEAILEAMTGPDRPWDDLHHRSYFLPELRRIEARENLF